MEIKEAEGNLILKCYGGSIAYGTNNKDSDTDIRGIFIPPKRYWIGFHNVKTVERISDKVDICYHSLRHFFDLAINANPNILELLFMCDNMYLPCKLQNIGKKLIAKREMFLTKKVKYTYTGYAFQMLHRMTRLNKNANTNPRRVQLVNTYGYDTKNALHLFRLMRTGLEILTTGELHVFRNDKDFLLEILNGKYTYEEIKAEAKRYEQLMEEAVVKSELPSKPSYAKIEEFLMELAEEAIWTQRHYTQ